MNTERVPNNSSQLTIHERLAVQKPHVTILTVAGILDINTAESLEASLLSLLRNERHRIVLNIGELTYLSSAGIGVLMANIKAFRDKGGDIKISNTPADIFKVFQIVDLPNIIQIFKAEEDAITGF